MARLNFNGINIKIEAYFESADNDYESCSSDEEIDKKYCPEKTVVVTGFTVDITDDCLLCYFENSMRSHGGSVVAYRREGRLAYVTFEKLEDAEKVKSIKHKLSKCNLSVTPFVAANSKVRTKKKLPENCTDKVRVYGISKVTTDECLKHFLESVTKIPVMEIQRKRSLALATFQRDLNFKSLKSVCKIRTLNGSRIYIKKVPVTSTVAVKNISPYTTSDAIEFYFENPKRSCGGDIEKLDFNKKKLECFVTFKNSKVLEEMLKKSHTIDDYDLEVQEYYFCSSDEEDEKNDQAQIDSINKLVSDAEWNKQSNPEAELAGMVQWHWVEMDISGKKLIEYPRSVNLELERAYIDSKPKATICDDNGIEYTVDFNRYIEYPTNEPHDTVEVIRRDNIIGCVFGLPKNWDDMNKTEQIKEVVLKSSSPEFQKVEKTFKDSVFQGKFQSRHSQSTFTVSKIIRIQNEYLYQQFEAKKKQLENQNPPGTKNEQILWYGTGSPAISSINCHGFNRSYCATANDAWYGNGVYFANDASYSCADWASIPDASGTKHVYMVRVLSGMYCQGQKGMRFLPKRTGNILYDSAVETTNNPVEFIIFNDTQAYPQYMIHFTK